MTRLVAHRLNIDLPPGWDGAIYTRRASGGAIAYPVLHAGNFALPPERGDFGGGAVEVMGNSGVFISLFEYGPESVGTALFRKKGLSLPLTSSHFNPSGLQRVIRGQAGHQSFFHEAGRAFCVYVVVGSMARAKQLAELATGTLSTLVIGNR